MTCRSVRKLLPLAAGGDLFEGKAGRVAAHIKTCAACRAELDAYRSALDRARELDGAAGHSWNDAAWAKAVRRAAAQGGRPAAGRPKFVLRPAVIAVAGAVLIAVAALLLVLTRNPIRPRQVLEARTEGVKTDVPAAAKHKPEPAPGTADQKNVKRDLKKEPEAPLLAAGRIKPSPAPIDRALTGAEAPAPPSPAQDIVSATFVSRETGLQIVWFFDRNFNWKGEEK
jgi:hypothetical protein